jgi:hypothetical protein
MLPQIAVTSYGPASQKCGSDKNIGAYTSGMAMRPWIDSMLTKYNLSSVLQRTYGVMHETPQCMTPNNISRLTSTCSKYRAGTAWDERSCRAYHCRTCRPRLILLWPANCNKRSGTIKQVLSNGGSRIGVLYNPRLEPKACQGRQGLERHAGFQQKVAKKHAFIQHPEGQLFVSSSGAHLLGFRSASSPPRHVG